MNKKIYILFIITLFNSNVFGQFIGKDDVSISIFYFQKEELDSAKKYINQATQDPELKTKIKSWYYKGIVYKDIYKKREKKDKKSPSRLEAIDAFKKAIELGAQEKFLESSKTSLKYLSSTLYNDAARLLNISDFDQAQKNYDMFKSILLLIEPETDLKTRDVTFKIALASTISRSSQNQVVLDSSIMDRIELIFLEVLEIDPENPEANFNLGSLYYNAAVHIINTLDYEIDLANLYSSQDTCVMLFSKALPYMKKSYDLTYKRKETLLGLSSIYYGLNDSEKHEIFKKELQDLETDE